MRNFAVLLLLFFLSSCFLVRDRQVKKDFQSSDTSHVKKSETQVKRDSTGETKSSQSRHVVETTDEQYDWEIEPDTGAFTFNPHTGTFIGNAKAIKGKTRKKTGKETSDSSSIAQKATVSTNTKGKQVEELRKKAKIRSKEVTAKPATAFVWPVIIGVVVACFFFGYRFYKRKS